MSKEGTTKSADDLLAEAVALLRSIKRFEANQGVRPPFNAEIETLLNAADDYFGRQTNGEG